MKSLPLILGAGSLALAAGAGLYWYQTQQGRGDTQTSLPQIAEGEQLVYQLRYSLSQKPQGEAERELFHLEGELGQQKQADGSLRSDWRSIERLRLLGAQVAPEVVARMAKAPTVTLLVQGELQHHIEPDFPGRFLGLQLSILDKAMITESRYRSETVVRKERDEFSLYNVSYSFEKDGQGLVVQRQWQQSADNRVVFDASANSIRYTYDSKGQLQNATGRLQFFYQKGGNQSDAYTAEFTMSLGTSEKVAAAPATLPPLPRADFARAEAESRKADQVESGADEAERTPVETIRQALVRLDTFSRSSPGEDQQEIFSSIKFGLMEDPSQLKDVVSKLKGLNTANEDAQTQSALVFGALAASGQPEVADAFVDLARSDCPDNFCKVQAAMALNTHEHPSADNARAMIAIAEGAQDEDVRVASYLAAGSAAGKVNAGSEDVTQALLTAYQASTDEDRKIALLKAMGNHGSADYLPVLEKEITSKEAFIKGSAAYSMRGIPGQAVTETLMNSFEPEDGSDIVNMDILKALNQRPLSADETQKIAKTFAGSRDTDIQQIVVDVLANAYRMDPKATEAAVETLSSQAATEDYKAFLLNQIGEIKSEQAETPAE